MPALTDRRILVTRPAGQSSPLAALLAEQGATPILIPTIELAAPRSWCALDAALACLRSYDFVLFTSANAVHAFVARARQLRLPVHPRRVAVVGPATAAAVIAAELRPDNPELLMPASYTAEALAEVLLPFAAGSQVLFARAAAAADLLPEVLAGGGAVVTVADTYQTLVPAASIVALTELFESEPPDAITFTSASTARNLAALLEVAGLGTPRGTVLASIGPITSNAMRQVGMQPTVEAGESTIAALVAAIADRFGFRE